MDQEKKFTAKCFCGDVKFELTGGPEVMAYCHCNSCRHWSGGEVSAFTLWKHENVKVTEGEDNIGVFNKTPDSARQWCRTCGGHLFTDHPSMGMFDVPASIIEGFSFEPGFHVHYQETVHPMKDGLPKFKDLPSAAGGSGEEIDE